MKYKIEKFVGTTEDVLLLSGLWMEATGHQVVDVEIIQHPENWVREYRNKPDVIAAEVLFKPSVYSGDRSLQSLALQDTIRMKAFKSGVRDVAI